MLVGYCDGCGQKITNDFTRPSLRVDITDTLGTPTRSINSLCDPCYIKVRMWMTDFLDAGRRVLDKL